jgi:hypothetical protein
MFLVLTLALLTNGQLFATLFQQKSNDFYINLASLDPATGVVGAAIERYDGGEGMGRTEQSQVLSKSFALLAPGKYGWGSIPTSLSTVNITTFVPPAASSTFPAPLGQYNQWSAGVALASYKDITAVCGEKLASPWPFGCAVGTSPTFTDLPINIPSIATNNTLSQLVLGELNLWLVFSPTKGSKQFNFAVVDLSKPSSPAVVVAGPAQVNSCIYSTLLQKAVCVATPDGYQGRTSFFSIDASGAINELCSSLSLPSTLMITNSALDGVNNKIFFLGYLQQGASNPAYISTLDLASHSCSPTSVPIQYDANVQSPSTLCFIN